ncbi:MAG: VCBS repeat-containing protein [Myxococcota bacterium]
MALLASLLPTLGCFTDPPEAMSGGGDASATTPGSGASSAGSATDSTPPTTSDTDGTAPTADETVTPDPTEGPEPGQCGDGEVVPGQLCFDEPSVTMANDAASSARLGAVTGTSEIDLVYLIPTQVVVHAGDGAGNWARPIFDASVMAGRFELADLDGDDELDLALLEAGGQVSVLLGSGLGSFAARGSATVDTDARALALGDLDGDGDPDLVVGTGASGLLYAMLTGSDGSLLQLPGLPVGGAVTGIATADFDGDTNLDVALSLGGTASATWLAMGTGDGGLMPLQAISSLAPDGNDIAAGDFDGDGNLDLAYVTDGPPSLVVQRGDGAGGFDAEVTIATGDSPQVVLAADLSDDGRDELVVGHGDRQGLRIFQHDGTQLLEALAVPLASTADDLAVGDVNEDGMHDIVVTSSGAQLVTTILSMP